MTGADSKRGGAIERWLAQLGLDRYAGAFADADVDVDILRDLSDDELKALGVTLGDRKRLLRAIAAFARAAGGEARR
jgi:hypothetical protein